jgi:hypothetical protein
LTAAAEEEAETTYDNHHEVYDKYRKINGAIFQV